MTCDTDEQIVVKQIVQRLIVVIIINLI